VVEELLASIAQLEARLRQEGAERRARAERQQAWGQQDGRRPGGRSWGWNGAEAQGGSGGAEAGPGREEQAGAGGAGQAGSPGGRRAGQTRQTAPDRQRAEALGILELSSGASRAAVKAAHRRLVKLHHPDMGGDAEVFRRINAAYQLLIA